ncbi:3-methyl-2-oxobutanoate hydroxymethyltransferase [Caulobacter sp. 17J80-11]|uniref:3-methyl-2-oxobutanoate hydroxymethyltransferase n=1 Tax=Caulobacter sp. 17J80-11 TaxID=2763502 RepID=UPI0016534746|nr:3-methyl-2-oxobutanoate hydroxymethyltransferase [Caulobacter sp. 17J80-11]MBC6982993.1 3-methyl-2-oxobutanoate hydroxymethyltransferase [Caulobacter sp. 17J80-11]
MSSHREEKVRRLAAPDIAARKGGDPIVCLTAYTAPMAEILDDHCDLLLVGDSVGMVMHGLPNTVGVTMEMMILHGQAVMRGARRAMVVIDMPFGSYEAGPEQAYANAARIMKETGAQAVKVESGPTVPETINYLVRRGIPVMGHIGLRPQAVLTDGAFKAKGKTDDERLRILAEAEATADAGAFSVVVEGVAEGLARDITEALHVPTIGIGASAACDGQILVVDDMLGLFDWTPKFVRRYADLRGEIGRAVAAYRDDVRTRRFPAVSETYFAKKPA